MRTDEIINKVFTRSFMGYDIEQVDLFLDELIEEMKSHLPEGVPSVFISSVSGLNIPRLKDMLWDALQP